MLTVEQLDTNNKSHVRRFVQLPFRLYGKHPQWVPPLLGDAEMQLNRNKHPYYEHSTAEFWLAVRDGRDVGRIAALENRPFNRYHGTRKANFYLFESEDDPEVAAALFERAFEWARARGLDTMVGPKGFGPVDGYGLLIEGYEHRQMMTMMNYNPPSYPRLVEGLGFEKEVDFVSCYLDPQAFQMPERVQRIADHVVARGRLRVELFTRTSDLRAWAPRIGKAYNEAFIRNWEYSPLSEREIAYVLEQLLLIADPRLIKVIVHGEDVVGFVFGFRDISAALQRARGHLFPLGLPALLLDLRRSDWVCLNGMGILEEFQGHGGNALLYSELFKLRDEFHFKHAELTQVAETAVQMRRDLVNMGGKPYKNHRVYRRAL